MAWEVVIGLETHAQLSTVSKIFSGASTAFGAPPNTQASAVDLALPGVLPVLNRGAVERAIRFGLAVGATIAPRSIFARKNYFYPDLPKGYQISQYELPVVQGGSLSFMVQPAQGGAYEKTVQLTRAHLEEDAGKSLHEDFEGQSGIDLNRAGTPLLEIVTYPDIGTPQEAVAFAVALRDICRSLGVTEGIMQKGHIRFEPNINVIIEKDGEPGVTYKTPIVEIKNLNSFKAVEGAIAHEYERQVEEWLETGRVMGSRAKSTRGWDDVRGVTTFQRSKEDADEYRYFPDPDLVPVVVTQEWIDEIKKRLPELPAAKRMRYVETLGLSEKDAEQLLSDPGTATFFDAVVNEGADAKRAAKLLLNTAAKKANERGVAIHDIGLSATQVKSILDLVAAGRINSNGADELVGMLCEAASGLDPLKIAEERGLLQVSDTGALEAFVDAVLADEKNAKAVADIKAGKDKAIGSLMGQVMKLSRGQANPQVVTELIRKKV